MEQTGCPCGSGAAFEVCCEPLLRGTGKAETAEALMRSRYTAYVHQDVDHLVASLLPGRRKKQDRRNVEAWAAQAEWRGLTILAVEGGGSEEDEGMVEFVAKYTLEGQDVEHHERATFRRQDGQWYFVEGRMVGTEPIVNESPRPRPNEACPCGSGAKYKRCCGR